MWWEYTQGGGGEKEGCFVGVLFVVFSLFQLRPVRVMVPSLGLFFLVVSRSPVFLGAHVRQAAASVRSPTYRVT